MTVRWIRVKLHKLSRYFQRNVVHCPPDGALATVLTTVLLLTTIYGALYVVLGGSASILPPNRCVLIISNTSRPSNDTAAASNRSIIPSRWKCDGGEFFSLYILFILAMLAGHVFFLLHLPPLLGMLAVGCILRNVPWLYVHLIAGIEKPWSSFLRSFALCIILLRAGLGLNPTVLKKLLFLVVRLSFLPGITEAIAVAIVSHFLLGLPWLWGFMLGFILAGVSTAVVVPFVLSLEQRGYGIDQGVPTLSLASASIDSVIAITGFSLALSLQFSTKPLWLAILMGPLEILLGLFYGIVGGLLLWFIPQPAHDHFCLYRFFLLLGLGLFAVFGSSVFNLPSSGSLGCLTIAFVAGIGWRRRDGWVDTKTNPLLEAINNLWWLAQPFLFGLIGSALDFASISTSLIGKGLGCIFAALAVRLLAAFLALTASHLNYKERLFVTFEWVAKATVQAAIGSRAYDLALSLEDEASIEHGLLVLNLAALSIIVTAPIGALLVAVSGPRLLTRTPVMREVQPLPDPKYDTDKSISANPSILNCTAL